MSLAYYIVLDDEDPGFDTFVNGKALAHEDGLNELCAALGLKSFDDYLTMSGDELSDLLGEDIELPEGSGEQWFDADEGLRWIEALAAHIRANPSAVTDAEGCLSDLEEYADVLKKTAAAGAHWHLSIDL